MDTDPAKVPGVNDENVGSLAFSPGSKVMLVECSECSVLFLPDRLRIFIPNANLN